MGFRIAVVGTFDLGNYGDLLFPLLARQALAERLGDVEIVPYSYRDLRVGDWPYDVRPLGELPESVAGCDLVVVGGGHLIRFDRDVAPGYGPTDAITHHPTGLWLGPTMLAQAAGVPVVWNALGAFGEIPPWARDLVGAVIRDVDLLAVRDGAAVAALRETAPEVEVRTTPDTGFGLAKLPAVPLRDELQGGPYVIVQASQALADQGEPVRALVAAAAAAGRRVLELPISPVLGDRLGLLAPGVETVPVEPWPSPAEIATLIAGADAVIARSLHLSITALAHGVPVHRAAAGMDEKYALLNGVGGLHLWDEGETAPELVLGRGEPSAGAREKAAEVAAHWDAVADLARDGAGREHHRPPGFVPLALAMLGAANEREQALIYERDGLRVETANLRNWVGEEQQRYRDLRDRRAVRAALTAAEAAKRAAGRKPPA